MEPISFSDYEILNFILEIRKLRPEWQRRAKCSTEPLENFYAGQGKSALLNQSIAFCGDCPVRFECLEYAFTMRDEYGVWGGSSPEQRRNWFKDGVSVEDAWEFLTSKDL